MNSLTFISVLLAALAMCAYGQDQNVTMGMVDVDANVTMTTAQPDPGMPNLNNTTDANTDNNDTTTSMPAMSNNDTTPAMPVMTSDRVTTDAVPETSTTPEMTTTPTDSITTTPSPCKKPTGRLDEIFAFTTKAEFTELAASTQIVIYEILAAAEGCKMKDFITPETAERIFRMLGELPVRYVYIFINYMAMALQNEGIVGPS